MILKLIFTRKQKLMSFRLILTTNIKKKTRLPQKPFTAHMAGNYFYYIGNSNQVMCNGDYEGDWSGRPGITGLSGFEENVGDERWKEGQG